MYYLFSLAKTVVLFLPRSIAYFLAGTLAKAYFFFSKREQEAVVSNLSVIIDDKKKLRSAACEVFVNFAYYLVDFFRYARFNLSFISKYVTLVGLENLDFALSQKKGIVGLSAHLGNYELGAAILAKLGYPVNVVALPHKEARLNDLFNAQRKMVGVEVIPTGVAIRRCYSLLRHGSEPVMFLGDRDFFGGGKKVKVFSKQAILPRGFAFFALKSNAYLLPLFCTREEGKRYKFIIEKPIKCGEGGLLTEDEIICEYVKILEKYLRNYPQQWYMFEKYWV